jgi:hypothetical protein
LSPDGSKDQLQRIDNLENKILMLESIILKSKNHIPYLPEQKLLDQTIETNQFTKDIKSVVVSCFDF